MFAYPQLFVSRTVGRGCGSQAMVDDTGHRTKVFHDGQLHRTVSTRPMSLLRRLPELEAAGFRRFLVDLRGRIVNRRELKRVIGWVREPERLKAYTNYNFKRRLR